MAIIMFKSIFSKYFTVVSTIIIISFMAMCAVQLLFSSRYWVADKQDLLAKNATRIAEHASDNIVQNVDGSYLLIEDSFGPLLTMLSEAIDSTVLITRNDGLIIASSDDNSFYIDKKLSSAIVSGLTGEQYFSVGTLDNLYETRQYTVGTPIIKKNSDVVLGYVFVSTSAGGLSSYLVDNFKVFFLSALGVLTLTFIALYAMTYRLVLPLRQMAAATRAFGVGDFSHRISVQGEDEVAELATSLNNMAISLSSVEGMRRSFVANVSHELKTPMTTIAGFIDGILDGTIPNEKRNYYLKIVSDEVKRLSRLVKSMLDLSRIDSGEMRLNPVRFDLTEAACNILLSFERRIDNKHLSITGLEDCVRTEVYADYDLIGQVMYNLLDNAVKFVNEGGILSIQIEKKDSRVYCAIRNSGAGIVSEEMPHIFERFYKSDRSRSLDKNGVGLGLYIVKSVINLHHGEIVVRSAEGQYCEFEFWLPDTEQKCS